MNIMQKSEEKSKQCNIFQSLINMVFENAKYCFRKKKFPQEASVWKL